MQQEKKLKQEGGGMDGTPTSAVRFNLITTFSFPNKINRTLHTLHKTVLTRGKARRRIA
jgi:hypothetical protein